MQRKKKAPKLKVKPTKLVKRVEDELVFTDPFHEVFPYTLKHLKDDKKVCYFQCEEHMKKYVERAKLNKKEYKVESTKPRNNDEEE
ncbi:MAG: hypothetical protein ACO3CQ_02540 [Candidatus Nanopelagicaceae bacterium]